MKEVMMINPEEILEALKGQHKANSPISLFELIKNWTKNDQTIIKFSDGTLTEITEDNVMEICIKSLIEIRGLKAIEPKKYSNAIVTENGEVVFEGAEGNKIIVHPDGNVTTIIISKVSQVTSCQEKRYNNNNGEAIPITDECVGYGASQLTEEDLKMLIKLLTTSKKSIFPLGHEKLTNIDKLEGTDRPQYYSCVGDNYIFRMENIDNSMVYEYAENYETEEHNYKVCLKVNKQKASFKINELYDVRLSYEEFKEKCPQAALSRFKDQIQIFAERGIDISGIPEELRPTPKITAANIGEGITTLPYISDEAERATAKGMKDIYPANEISDGE